MIAVAGYINYSDNHLGIDKTLKKASTKTSQKDEEETQDCMNVYTNENGKLRLLTEKTYCKMQTEGKTLSEVVQAVKQSIDDFLKMGIQGKLKQLQCYEQVKQAFYQTA